MVKSTSALTTPVLWTYVKQICTVKKGSTMKFEYFFKLANITTQSTGKDLTLLFGMFHHPS